MLPLPDPDLAAEMYEWASGYLDEQGFVQYEISNWAKLKCESQHNLQYWRNLPYLGFGAGAHGSAVGMRYSNVLRIQTFIDRLVNAAPKDFPHSPAMVSFHKIDLETEMNETMMLGLRLTQEGVSADAFQTRFGRSMKDIFSKEIDELLKFDLLEWAHSKTSEVSRKSDVLRLTKRARLLGNQVFRRFVE